MRGKRAIDRLCVAFGRFYGAQCSQCARGFFGDVCLPCPGAGEKAAANVNNVCDKKGWCDWGKQGGGKCACNSPFTDQPVDTTKGTCSEGACQPGYFMKPEPTPPGDIRDAHRGERFPPEQMQCTPCPAGTYLPEGLATCVPCPPETFCGEAATETTPCQLCPPGHGEVNPGTCANGGALDRVCQPCEAGRFSDKEGTELASLCKRCDDRGRKAICPLPGTAEPLTCSDPNAEATADARFCECVEGHFAAAKAGADASTVNVKCEKCPDGVNCAERGLVYGNLTVAVGIWQNPDWIKSASFLATQGVEACRPGRWIEGIDQDPLCLGGDIWTTCREGHAGVKCEVRVCAARCPRRRKRRRFAPWSRSQ